MQRNAFSLNKLNCVFESMSTTNIELMVLKRCFLSSWLISEFFNSLSDIFEVNRN